MKEGGNSDFVQYIIFIYGKQLPEQINLSFDRYVRKR